MNNNRKTELRERIVIASFFLLAIGIPLAFLRIPFFHTSLSIASCIGLVVIVVLGAVHMQKILLFLRIQILFYSLYGGMIVLLLFSALLTGTQHAFGIWLEWFVIPSVSATVLAAVVKKRHTHFFVWAVTLCIAIIVGLASYSFFAGDSTYDGRLRSFWVAPTYLALLLGSVPFFFMAFVRIAPTMAWRIVYTSLGVATLFVLFLTQSVFAILSITLGMTLGAVLYKVHYRKVTIRYPFVFFGLLLFLSLSILGVVRGQTFLEDVARSSLASRITIWSVGKEVLAQQPLTGHGVGTFQDVYLAQQQFYPPYLEWSVPTPHNLYMMLWYTGGFGTLLLFLSLVFLVLGRLCNTFFTSTKKAPLFIMGALVTIGVHGLFDTPVFGVDLGYLFWGTLLAGLSMTQRDVLST